MKKLLIMSMLAGWMGFGAVIGCGNVFAFETVETEVIKLEKKDGEKTKETGDKKKEKKAKKEEVKKEEAKKEEGSAAESGPEAIVIPARKPVDESASKAKKDSAVFGSEKTAGKAAVAGNPSVSEKLKGETQRVSSAFESNFQKIYGMSSTGAKDSSAKKT